MIGPELALAKTFIDLLVGRDVYEAPRIVSEVADVLLDVDEAEAALLPAAFATALRAVSSDLARWRVAAEAAVQLDLFECAAPIIEDLRRLGDPHQMGNAALLLGNPGVPPEQREAMTRHIRDRDLTMRVRQLLEVRLGDSPDAGDELAKVLDTQVWPGRHSAADLGRFAPVVYVAELGAPLDDYWRVIGALCTSGARIRRVGAQVTELPNPAWANRHSPLVCWSGRAIAQWRELTKFEGTPAVMVPPTLDSKLGLPRVVNEVRTKLPPSWNLRPLQDVRETAGHSETFTPENLREGGFDALEMMYLGAAGRHVVQTLARDVLVPWDGDRQRWTFDQLVTLRLVQGFKVHRRAKADAKKVFERLHDIALANTASEVAFDANGQIYVDEGEGYRTIEGQQEALGEVLKVDVAFRPFKLGGGMVPDLLNPSARTMVDPRIMGGTPIVRGRRVSARAINDVFALRGEAATRSAFPELDAAAVADAVRVGRQIDVNRSISR